MTTRRPDPVECPDFDDMRDYPHGAPLTIKGKLQAGRRDASFLASPDVHSFKVNHVIVAHGSTPSAGASRSPRPPATRRTS
jgi:hypothetical protein